MSSLDSTSQVSSLIHENSKLALFSASKENLAENKNKQLLKEVVVEAKAFIMAVISQPCILPDQMEDFDQIINTYTNAVKIQSRTIARAIQKEWGDYKKTIGNIGTSSVDENGTYCHVDKSKFSNDRRMEASAISIWEDTFKIYRRLSNR